LLNLPPGAFRPAPKVQSTVVRLRFHPPDPPVRDETVLAAVVGAAFSRRRKTMGNALLAYGALTPSRVAAALAEAGIDPVRRPATLTIDELCRVADAIDRDLHGNTTKPAAPPVL
jgi:16S rRNA (adenine1518-N6/adenine1519-N6)-dimethyltransferase